MTEVSVLWITDFLLYIVCFVKTFKDIEIWRVTNNNGKINFIQIVRLINGLISKGSDPQQFFSSRN